MTQALDRIVGLIRKQAGFDLSGYKPTPVLRRVAQRMKLRRVGEFAAYEALLQDDPAELEALIHGIPIHVTEFFRDPPAWDVLGEHVMEGLCRGRKPSEPIRIWTPACATGEEAYSVAMLLSEYVEASGRALDFQVFATDASPGIVARASRGVFSEKALRCLAPQRRAQFVEGAEGVLRVKRTLREKMAFATQDLLTDPPFTHLDLVTCRNVLIYLDREAIQRVLLMVHSALRVGGYLFLGKGEPLSPGQAGFETVSTRWHIYRKEGRMSEIPLTSRGNNTNGRAATQECSQPARSSNEELEASREELQVLNAELNASNQQLMAANEGLHQVNVWLKEKRAELEMQRRVLSSGEVTTLFLDRELCVRWFTTAIIDLFPLKPTDVGRCITDLVPRFKDQNFITAVHGVMLTGVPDEAEVRNVNGRCFLRRIRPYLADDKPAGGVAVTFTDITERTQAETELRRTEASVMAQKEAFQAALSGVSLKTSLDFLARAAMDQMGEGARCAFYLVDEAGLELRHITGIPDDCAVCVGGVKVGPDALACGLAIHTGRPVITPDVAQEPRWQDWLRLSTGFPFRGCWSFPLETAASKVIGTFAVYHPQPRAASSRELELARLLTRAAALIISRQQATDKRA